MSADNKKLASKRISERKILEAEFLSYFDSMVANILNSGGLERLDWYSNCLSRNPRRSDLMRNVLVGYRLRNTNHRKFDSEITDRLSVYLACKYFIKSKKVKLKIRAETTIFRLFKPFLNLALQLSQLTLRTIIGSLTKSNPLPGGNYHLIDTFAYSSRDITTLLNDHDRHFPQLSQTLDLLQKPHLILPTLIHVRSPIEFWRVVTETRRSGRNIIIKEQLLGFFGLMKVFYRALASPLGLFRLIKVCKFDGDLPLVISDFYCNLFSSDFFQAITTECALENLKRRGIVITTALLWHENQPVDKAICYSLRQFHNVHKIVGYQGYIVPPTFVCKRPLEEEKYASFAPDLLALSVKQQVQSEDYNSLPRVLAPPFRFSSLFSVRLPEDRSSQVLIALPITDSQASSILKIVLPALSVAGCVNILVKPHPSNSMKAICRILENISADVVIPEIDVIPPTDDIYEHLHAATIVFSAASSFCFEAVALDLRLGLICDLSIDQLIEDPLSEFKDKRLRTYTLCDSADDIAQMLQEHEVERSESKLDDLFLPPNVETQMKFYGEVFGE